MDRIEIDGGVVTNGPDLGKQMYFVSLNWGGAEMGLWSGTSYGRALLEGQLCSVGFELPLVDEVRPRRDGSWALTI